MFDGYCISKQNNFYKGNTVGLTCERAAVALEIARKDFVFLLPSSHFESIYSTSMALNDDLDMQCS